MSETTVEVWLGESKLRAGFLVFSEQGQRVWSTFRYDDAWLQQKNSWPISPDLPLRRDWFTKKATSAEDSCFHFAIQDTEPDGWAKQVIHRTFVKEKKAQPSAKLSRKLSPLDYLLFVDDASRIGALRFCYPNGEFLGKSIEGRRTTPPMLELASIINAVKAIELNQETLEDLNYLRGRGSPLGGLRPKCSIINEDNQLCIGKFPSIKDMRSVTKGEVLALHLAQNAKIDAAQSKVVGIDGTPVAVITRFDRTRSGRIPYLSAASLIMADLKENHYYTEIADVIRQKSPDANHDLHELWRRIVFNMLITNVDDHLHNHGFLHNGNGQWRLSPAFDINPFPDKDRELKIWLTEESGPTGSIKEAVQEANKFNLNHDAAIHILREVTDAVTHWRKVAASKAIGMTPTEIEAFEPAFEHEEFEEAKRICSSLIRHLL